MKITLLEPYLAGSHEQWANGLASNFDVQLLSLKGQYWKWRMHGGAISLATQFSALEDRGDIILATDMLDLTTFLSLADVGDRPVAMYFHENQLTYPWSPSDRDVQKDRDNHYGFINYASALAADWVFFNSAYHRDSFLEALTPFLKHFPDARNMDSIDVIRNKSSVLPLALDLHRFDALEANDPHEKPRILWNHRWEYDKNPDLFFSTLSELKNEGLEFELIVLGEHFVRAPEVFEKAKDELGAAIIQFGFADSFQSYAEWLWKSDIAPITSNQDFFGISAIEAAYCNNHIIAPDRLAFPEVFGNAAEYYRSDDNFKAALKKAILDFPELNYQKFHVGQYDWTEMKPFYQKAFEGLLS